MKEQLTDAINELIDLYEVLEAEHNQNVKNGIAQPGEDEKLVGLHIAVTYLAELCAEHHDTVIGLVENHYQCPDCDVLWDDQWQSSCDDECPSCGCKGISPYDSQSIAPYWIRK